MARPLRSVFVLGLALAAAGCEEKKTSESHVDVDAATDKFAAADPKLERALKAAASASANADNGPPPGGVFAPGAADRRHAKSVPTKVELVSHGAEPRISLRAGVDASAAGAASAYGPAVLEAAMQILPRSVLPTVDFTLSLGPAKKDEGGDAWLVATVNSSSQPTPPRRSS
jgi:hypothetical protein